MDVFQKLEFWLRVHFLSFDKSKLKILYAGFSGRKEL